MKTTETLESTDWDSDGCRTPEPFFAELRARYNFVVDLFASTANAKLPMFFTKEDSAFNHDWPRLSRGLQLLHAPNYLTPVTNPGPHGAEVDQVLVTKTVPPEDQPDVFGWNYGNPRYSAGGCAEAIEGSVLNARRGSGIVLLMPSSTGAGWFQKGLLRPCNVLDAYQVNGTDWLNGYELSMQGIGYRQKIRFLSRRPPFDPPIGYPEDRKWSGPAGDSVLVELRPPL